MSGHIAEVSTYNGKSYEFTIGLVVVTIVVLFEQDKRFRSIMIHAQPFDRVFAEKMQGICESITRLFKQGGITYVQSAVGGFRQEFTYSLQRECAWTTFDETLRILGQIEGRSDHDPPQVEAMSQQVFEAQLDAPPCHACGARMIRDGLCHICPNCGATSGCS